MPKTAYKPSLDSTARDFALDKTSISRFVPIAPESIADGEARNFSLYLYGDGRFVLYRRSELPLAIEDLTRLKENGVDTLWILSTDHKKYLRHLQSNLEKILTDYRVPIQDRSKLLYEVSRDVMEDLFKDPDDPVNLTRVESLAKDQMHFLEKEPLAFRSLLGLTCHHYYTFTHSVHVSIISSALALRQTIIDKENREKLALAGLLHDLGKTLISTDILDKPGKLDQKEWIEIKNHPTNGRQLAKQGGVIDRDILGAIEQHHEKYMGGGYPNGIGGNEINILARYLTVADVFDAMTTKRAYDRRYSAYAALDKMVRQMKNLFDPEILKVLISLLGEPVMEGIGRKVESGGTL
ncbi:MAG: HD domain-containing protein [Deltaproteobacteria bacterium]|nr:HD domain-containing protein [Deltaproteobacteria bacterium]